MSGFSTRSALMKEQAISSSDEATNCEASALEADGD
jgi:hypothetical protein